MRDGRQEIDQFLFKFRDSGLIPDGGSILEIGSGQLVDYYAMFHDRWQFQPTDVTEYPEMPDMEWLNALDFDTSPLIKRQPEWDAILASQILEHVPEPIVLIRECYKHLKVGGILIVTTPFWYRIHETDPADPSITEKDLLDYWRITPSGLKYLFGKAGFQKFYVTPIHKPTDYPKQPTGVGGWAQRLSDYPTDNGCPEILDEWDVSIASLWRIKQAGLESDFRNLKETGNG